MLIRGVGVEGNSGYISKKHKDIDLYSQPFSSTSVLQPSNELKRSDSSSTTEQRSIQTSALSSAFSFLSPDFNVIYNVYLFSLRFPKDGKRI